MVGAAALGRRKPLCGAQAQALANINAAFARMRAAPASLELWWGHPYRCWASYLWDNPIVELLRLNVPIFVAHGTRHMSVSIESGEAIAKAFDEAHRTNLTRRRYPKLDHRWRESSGRTHLQEVGADIDAWINQLAHRTR